MAGSAAEAEIEVVEAIETVRVPADVPPGGAFTVASGKTTKSGKEVKAKTYFRASGRWPTLVPRNVVLVAGKRHSQRPSATSKDVIRDTQETTADDNFQWQTDEELPWERASDDAQWLPGPAPNGRGITGRAMPKFTGPKQGPTDRSLNKRSTARQIMGSVQFSERYLNAVVAHAKQHCVKWREAHGTGGLEAAFDPALLKPEHVELWLALRVKLASLNTSIAAEWVWDKDKTHFFDAAVHRSCPLNVYKWLNRHLSFGDYGEGPADGAERVRFDRFAKRRELSNIAKEQARKAYNPGQHIGIDDAVRSTRHLDGKRIRYKAQSHTGKIVHSLNDGRTHYFLHWEEQGWNAGDTEEDDNSPAMAGLCKRLGSAVKSNVGHVLWMDKGYTTQESARALSGLGIGVCGVTSADRVGLPRRFIAELKKRLTCARKCEHGADCAECKRWVWCVLHKYSAADKCYWELELWSDGNALVICLSNCASATRTVKVCRTAKQQVFEVHAPEAIGKYSIFGRSCTDIGDEYRKRISLAVRRQLRQGPKGALFDAELGFVNGLIVMRALRKCNSITTWEFCDAFVAEVLRDVSIRRRDVGVALALPLSPAPGSSGIQTRDQAREHVPVNFVEQDRAKRRRNEEAPTNSRRGHKCNRTDCEAGAVKRPEIYCPGCDAWYHFSCFFCSHGVYKR